MPYTATTPAPMAGPTMPLNCWLRLVSELALGKASAGVKSGTTALKAGKKNACSKPKAMLATYTCQISRR